MGPLHPSDDVRRLVVAAAAQKREIKDEVVSCSGASCCRVLCAITW